MTDTVPTELVITDVKKGTGPAIAAGPDRCSSLHRLVVLTGRERPQRQEVRQLPRSQ